MGGWFYNSVSGVLNRVPTIGEGPYRIPGLGWHELRIPYTSTRAQAINAAKLEFPGGATPGGSLIGNAGQDVAKATGLSPLGSVGDFFHRLTEKETWTRAGEIALGGILIYAGVRALSSGTGTTGVARSATAPVKKVSKTVTKVAAPEVRYATRKTAKRVAPRATAHRAKVARYGAKSAYRPPAPRPTTKRVSHIYYHKAGPTVKKVKP